MMPTYAVHVVPQLGTIGQIAVIVVRIPPASSDEGSKVVASTTGCRSIERAEEVAFQYRAQFGVGAVL
jgi:hypothetical protein